MDNNNKNTNNQSQFFDSLYIAIKSKDLNNINTAIYSYNHDIDKLDEFSETQICSLLDLSSRRGILSVLIFLDKHKIDITRQRFYYLKSAAKSGQFSIVEYYLNNHPEAIKIASKNINRRASVEMKNFLDSWSSSKQLSDKLNLELNDKNLSTINTKMNNDNLKTLTSKKIKM